MSFAIEKNSFNEWNNHFSTEVEINKPDIRKLVFENNNHCDIKLYNIIDIKSLNKHDKKQQEDIKKIINSSSFSSIASLIEIYAVKSKPENLIMWSQDPVNEINGSLTTVTITLTFIIPFKKFDLLLCFVSQSEDTSIVVPLKGLTSFDLQAKPDDIEECNDGNEHFILEKKFTVSRLKLLKTLDQDVVECQIIGNGPNEKKLFEKQVKIHQSLRCAQISSFMYAIPESNSLIFERPRYWTLTNYLTTNEEINRTLMYKFCLDVSKAMDYLQESQIVHRDLSTDNVFVFSVIPTDYVNCKLGNICCCERVSEYGIDATVTKPIYSNQGENFRMPPEITSKDASYTSQCDVYSFGILVFHVLTQLVNTNPIGESGCVLPQFIRQIPSALVNIINNCCSINVNERPSFSEIVERLNIILQNATTEKINQRKKQKTVKFPFV
ncbi:protein kinase domain containing protein [Entamoeba histolytica]